MNIEIKVPKSPEDIPQAESQQIRRVANVLEARGHKVDIIWGEPVKLQKVS